MVFKAYSLIQLVRFTVSELYARLWRYPVLRSFSQNGEDLVLDKLFGFKKRGFYIDIGAYDPFRFSNTMRFYLKGWRGINIEPDPERFTRFQGKKSKDINLNMGIASKKGNLTYYRINPATLSTFDKQQALAYERQGFAILDISKVPVLPLTSVFNTYAKKKSIDFMSIDVEGWEMEVLASSDWKKFRPHFVCIESADYSKTKNGEAGYRQIGSFFAKNKYKKIFDNGLNSIYKDETYE